MKKFQALGISDMVEWYLKNRIPAQSTLQIITEGMFLKTSIFKSMNNFFSSIFLKIYDYMIVKYCFLDQLHTRWSQFSLR